MKGFPVVLILGAIGLVLACSPSPFSHVVARLDDVESYINDHPDSALSVLRSVDTTALHTRALRARAALLHQIALDKCYIDITSDSILAPANWYLRHGTADQKLKTWYYRSVLARNAGDRDEQMLCLVRGERFIPRARDPLYAGFVYTAKRVAFLDLFDLEDASANAEKAVESFRQTEERDRYYNAIIGLANIYNLQERYEESSNLLDSLKSHWDDLSARQRNQVYNVELKILSETGEASEIIPYVAHYLEETPSSQIDWVLVAKAHLAGGSPQQAGQALERVSLEARNDDQTASLLQARSEVLRATGYEEESLEANRQFREIVDQRLERGLASRVRFTAAEEAYRRSEAHKRGWIVFLVTFCFCLGIAVLMVKRRLRKRLQMTELLQGQLEESSSQIDSLKQQVYTAKKEVERWKELLQKEQFPPATVKLVTERIEALNRYALMRLSKNDSQKALSELETVLSRESPEQFISDLTHQYGYLHPKLVHYLAQYRLSEQERKCCVLLAMGFSVKEVSSLVHLSPQRCYNIFNTIRGKMRLKEDSRTLQVILCERL